MTLTFDQHSVLRLPDDTESMQCNRAVAFCREWIGGADTFTFHTSGSTAAPKKVVLTRHQLEASAAATIKFLHLTADEHILVCLNTHLIAGTMMLVRGMMLGCKVTVTEPSTRVMQTCGPDHPYTFVSFVPFQLKDAEQPGLARFRNILVGGAAVPDQMEHRLGKLGTAVWHTYGMTETVSHIALRRIGTEKEFAVLPGIDIRTDERECLCIRGEVTRNEWLVTNDLAEITDASHFRLQGRNDHVINSGGVKVQPEKVEMALEEAMLEVGCPLLEACVTGVPHAELGEQVAAVIAPSPVSAAMVRTFVSALSGKLSRYEMPGKWMHIDSLRLTASGKVDRKASAEAAVPVPGT